MAEPGPADDGNRPATGIRRLVDVLADWCGYTSAVLVLVSALVICYAVVLRYVLGASTVWQTEFSIYLLMYASFVGAPYGLKHRDHVGIDLIVIRLRPRVRLLVEAVASLLGFALVAVLFVLGFELVWEAVQDGETSGTAWNPPMAIPYAILPAGMLVLAMQLLLLAADSLRALRSAPPGDGAGAAAERPLPGSEGGVAT